ALGGKGSNPEKGFLTEPGNGHPRIPGGDGGDAHGGGLYVSGTATIRNCSVVGNSAQGGSGGGQGGTKGQGGGGGHYINSRALVGLDAYTLDHVKKNLASTSDDNIHGLYDVIL